MTTTTTKRRRKTRKLKPTNLMNKLRNSINCIL